MRFQDFLLLPALFFSACAGCDLRKVHPICIAFKSCHSKSAFGYGLANTFRDLRKNALAVPVKSAPRVGVVGLLRRLQK